MPFIRGRYHINPIAGEALEAAREAEAAFLALERDAQGAQQNDAGDCDGGGNNTSDASSAASSANAPIHRVEIEAAEMVPAHSGRAERGFVARVHRALPASEQASDDGFGSAAAYGQRSAGTDNFARVASPQLASQPETHVFAGHRDLVSFLRDEFAKDCK